MCTVAEMPVLGEVHVVALVNMSVVLVWVTVV
jgi:hypothetical protein